MLIASAPSSSNICETKDQLEKKKTGIGPAILTRPYEDTSSVSEENHSSGLLEFMNSSEDVKEDCEVKLELAENVQWRREK